MQQHGNPNAYQPRQLTPDERFLADTPNLNQGVYDRLYQTRPGQPVSWDSRRHDYIYSQPPGFGQTPAEAALRAPTAIEQAYNAGAYERFIGDLVQQTGLQLHQAEALVNQRLAGMTLKSERIARFEARGMRPERALARAEAEYAVDDFRRLSAALEQNPDTRQQSCAIADEYGLQTGEEYVEQMREGQAMGRIWLETFTIPQITQEEYKRFGNGAAQMRLLQTILRPATPEMEQMRDMISGMLPLKPRQPAMGANQAANQTAFQQYDQACRDVAAQRQGLLLAYLRSVARSIEADPTQGKLSERILAADKLNQGDLAGVMAGLLDDAFAQHTTLAARQRRP